MLRRGLSLRNHLKKTLQSPGQQNGSLVWRLEGGRRQFHATLVSLDALDPVDSFSRRHLGPRDSDAKAMLQSIGFNSFDELVASTVPPSIFQKDPMTLDKPMSESEALSAIRAIADKNKVMKSYIGTGYYDTIVPPVILRNVLENPGWYTAYTPYQAEISQGRLEMLLNFQTMVCDLTGMEMSVASLLDEATAAAEAMQMCYAIKGKRGKNNMFFVSEDVHPQTIALLQTRAGDIGIDVVVGNHSEVNLDDGSFCGALIQYPNTYGTIESPGESYESFTKRVHEVGAMLICATDLMALGKIAPPSRFGADICVGSAQRFGVPMGFGGPHAGFLASSEQYSRKMPGRIIGVTVDHKGKPCLRMAMQTREQHIRRDKATSNICTAQALLANMAASYAIYHGPEGISKIGGRIHALAKVLHRELSKGGFECSQGSFFDTFTVDLSLKGMTSMDAQNAAVSVGANVRVINDTTIGISLGEGITRDDIQQLLNAFGVTNADLSASDDVTNVDSAYAREGPILQHPIFHASK